MTQVTKDMTISELLAIDSNIAGILMQNGMHCVGCPSSQAETLEEASQVHGMDVTLLVATINDYLSTK